MFGNAAKSYSVEMRLFKIVIVPSTIWPYSLTLKEVNDPAVMSSLIICSAIE
jgi:hypothetical protein